MSASASETDIYNNIQGLFGHHDNSTDNSPCFLTTNFYSNIDSYINLCINFTITFQSPKKIKMKLGFFLAAFVAADGHMGSYEGDGEVSSRSNSINYSIM